MLEISHAIKIIAIASLIAASSCSEASGQRDWQEYEFEASGFIAKFPEKPEMSREVVNTAIGAIEMIFQSVTISQTAFTIAIADYPKDYFQGNDLAPHLDNARDYSVAGVQGKLLLESIIDIEGHPGREIKVSVAGGAAVCYSRIFIVDSKLYTIGVVVPTANSYAPEVRFFLDSFRLIGIESKASHDIPDTYFGLHLGKMNENDLINVYPGAVEFEGDYPFGITQYEIAGLSLWQWDSLYAQCLFYKDRLHSITIYYDWPASFKGQDAKAAEAGTDQTMLRNLSRTYGEPMKHATGEMEIYIWQGAHTSITLSTQSNQLAIQDNELLMKLNQESQRRGP